MKLKIKMGYEVLKHAKPCPICGTQPRLYILPCKEQGYDWTVVVDCKPWWKRKPHKRIEVECNNTYLGSGLAEFDWDMEVEYERQN